MQKFKYLSLIFALLIISSTANAGLITDWDYDIVSGFSTYAPVDDASNDAVIASNNNSLGDPTKLSWFAYIPEDDRSSLVVTQVTGSNLQTNAGDVAGSTLTHSNNPITPLSNSESLLTTTLFTRLALNATAPITGVPFLAPDISFNIRFYETPHILLDDARNILLDDNGDAISFSKPDTTF